MLRYRVCAFYGFVYVSLLLCLLCFMDVSCVLVSRCCYLCLLACAYRFLCWLAAVLCCVMCAHVGVSLLLRLRIVVVLGCFSFCVVACLHFLVCPVLCVSMCVIVCMCVCSRYVVIYMLMLRVSWALFCYYMCFT